jgi:glycosyltransferase involved in cell wall biosynthesis
MKSKPTLQIAIASGVRGDTRRYRTFHLFEQCCSLGLKTCLTHVMLPDFQNVVREANLLILHRAGWDPNIQRAIDDIHRRGGRVIYDTDDLLFDPVVFKWIDSPDFQDPVRAKLYQEEMQRHNLSMKLCDAIMTSTAYLESQAKQMDRPTFVHRNAFSNEMLGLSDHARKSAITDSGKIVIGYASGTPTHNRDFESCGQALRATLDANKLVKLWLVGPIKLDREWINYKSRILHLPYVPWRLLPAYLVRFDINLAPLVIDNPFAQSKSEIKWIEAGLVSVPTIASSTSAFQTAIHQGIDGMVVSSMEDWQKTLTGMVGDKDLRKEMGEAARKEVIRSCSPEVRANEFRLILEKVTGQENLSDGSGLSKPTRETSGRYQTVFDSKAVSRLEKTPSMIMMAGYSLHFRGMATLIKQIWIFFRRAISPIIPFKKRKVDA